MKKTIFSLSIFVFIILFAYGFYHYQSKLNSISAKVQNEKATIETKQLEVQKSIEDNKHNSLNDWITYQTSKKDSVTISLLGTDATAQSSDYAWSHLLANDLKDKVEGTSKVIVKNQGFEGYTTAELAEESTVAEVVATQPDIILFEIGLINNFEQNVSIASTKNNLTEIVSTLEDALPNSIIILQTANEISNTDLNNVYMSYAFYNEQISSFIEEKGWNFIDVYYSYIENLEENRIEIDDITDESSLPNKEGNAIWFSIIQEEFASKELYIE